MMVPQHDDDVWRGQVSSELRHIAGRLREVQQQIHDLRCFVAGELAAHARYHEENEHQWGLVKWARMHPLRFAAVVAALAVLAASSGGATILDLLRAIAGG